MSLTAPTPTERFTVANSELKRIIIFIFSESFITCHYLNRPLLTASLKSGSQDTLPPLAKYSGQHTMIFDYYLRELQMKEEIYQPMVLNMN